MSDASSDAIRGAAHHPAGGPATAVRPAAGGATGRPHGTFLVHTAADLRALRGTGPRAEESGSDGGGGTGQQRAVVMTMGALHEGHAALVAAARGHVGWSGQVVVTVFVNPLQFGPSEDLDRYPRTLDADLLVAERAGADVVFAPDVDEVYPGGDPQVRIAAGPVGDRLEGASRPGHFDGMLTVVAKLLHLTAPDVAFFGQKDAQQLALVRRMAADLNFPVGIVGVPTHRESDGMARSSRNRYLSPAERDSAAELRRALLTAEQAVRSGSRAVVRAARAILDNEQLDPPVETDYVALVDPSDFTEVPDAYEGEALLAVAARVGTTRLIDNIPLHLPATGGADGGVTG